MTFQRPQFLYLGAGSAALPVGDDKHTILRHYLFGKLTPQHIDRLSACIVTKAVKRGTNIFAKGEPGTSLCAIREGTVKISVSTVDGKDAVFNMLHKGAIFGEIALLDGNPRTADATAATDCGLFVIERRDFLPLMREEPDIAIRISARSCAGPPSRRKRSCSSTCRAVSPRHSCAKASTSNCASGKTRNGCASSATPW
jgi:CRP/FNR family transcriptional regulator, cyclic AMP receptor protein